MNTPQEKPCRKCKLPKSLDEYGSDKSTPDGKATRCKACMREKSADFRLRHPDYMREYTLTHVEEKKQYTLEHANEIAAYQKQYRQNHAEELREKTRKRHEENPELIRNQKAASYQRNKEKIAAKQKEKLANRTVEEKEATRLYMQRYFADHFEELMTKQRIYNEEHQEQISAYHATRYQEKKEEMQARLKAWRKANPKRHKEAEQRRRARKANAPINDLSAEQWEETLIAFNFRCAYCPQDCKDCRYKRHKLTQEHVTPYHHNGSHTLWNVVPACQFHNSKKGRKKAVLQPIQPLLLTLAPSKPYKPRKKGT